MSKHKIYQLLKMDNAQDADALASLLTTLEETVPAPPHNTTSLIQRLEAEMPVAHQAPQRKISWMMLVLRSQIRVVQKEIWWASLLIMLVGTLVSLVSYNPENGNMTALAVIAPVIAAVGVGLLYDDDMALIRELEDTTLAPTPMLLFARLLLIFMFDLVLALAGSVALATLETQLSLMPVIMTWLAPMTFLSALAFFISVTSAQAVAGGLVALVLWAMHLFMSTVNSDHIALQILSFQGLSALTTRPFLFIVSVLLILVSLWFLQLQERLHGAFNP